MSEQTLLEREKKKADRILVTGAGGFIGSRLVEALLESGFKVAGVDIDFARLIHPHYKHFRLDFTDYEKTYEVFRRFNPSICYHLGAIADLNYARVYPRKTVKVNVMGTANIADICSKEGILLNFVSSCCVYGHTPDHPSTEDARKRPAEIYGCTKLAAEQVILGYHQLYGLSYNIARPSSVYGEGMRSALAIYIFIDKALRGEKLPIHGSGKQTRCFVYVDDLVDGLLRLTTSGVRNEVFNMAGSEEKSVLEVASKVMDLVGGGELEFVADRPGQVMKEQIDISKARQVLGWEPKTLLAEGLLKTMVWMKKCRKKYLI